MRRADPGSAPTLGAGGLGAGSRFDEPDRKRSVLPAVAVGFLVAIAPTGAPCRGACRTCLSCVPSLAILAVLALMRMDVAGKRRLSP